MVRWKRYLDWILTHFIAEAVKRDLRYLLWMSLYQVFFMRKGAHHVVNEAVEYVKREKGQKTANFFNAVIRRSIREREALPLPSDPLSRLSITHSFPEWLVRRWSRRFDVEELERLLTHLNKDPEFAVRIDLSRTTREAVTERLAEAGVRTRNGRFLDTALWVDRIGPVLESDLFARHLVHVQDETSQLAGHAVATSVRDGWVLDACAGQGTKTDQIKEETPGARVVAMDIDVRKLRSSGRASYAVGGDAVKNPFKAAVFDSILLDAPCSSLGILRKHAEIRWRRSEEDIATYGGLQKAMIRSLANNLKTGGLLVYSVCSFEPEETLDVVEEMGREGAFSQENPLPDLFDATHFLSVPHATGMDGFFVAGLRKL